MPKESNTSPPAPGRKEPQPPFPAQHLEGVGREADLEPRPRYSAPSYKPANKLAGKVALVTGGDSGIGRAVAVIFAREGADVAFTYLDEEEDDARESRDTIESLGRRCLMLKGDLTDPTFCEEVVDRVNGEFGRLDILVSNAARQQRRGSLDELTSDEISRTFSANIYAYFHLARAALRIMPRGGAIIATGSETGMFGSASLPDYSATKGAIHAFTKTLAQALVPRGIRANVVAPGPVWTPLNPADPGLPPDKVAEFGSQTPYGRPAQPEEIAPAYVFLASEADSSYITGVVLPVLGGETAGA